MQMKVIQIGFSLFTVSRALSTTVTRATRGMTRRLIVDTDTGFDDIIAIGALIQNNRDIALVTTVHGANKAAYGAQALQSLFPSIRNIKAGIEETTEPSSWVPDARKLFRDFLKENNIPMTPPHTDGSLPKTNLAKDAVKQLLSDNPEEIFDLMCIGPLSNVADWISDDTIAMQLHSQINAVWIMGGSLTKPGEFNFGQAPQAASMVVTTLSDKIHLVMSEDSGPEIAPSGFTESIIAASDSSSLYTKILQKEKKMVFWDPICVFAFIHPTSVSIEEMAVTVDSKTGLVVESVESTFVLKRVTNVPLEDYKVWVHQLVDSKEAAATR